MKFSITKCLLFGVPLLAFAAASPLSRTETSLEARDVVKYSAIPNGQPYYDTAGNPIQAFGGAFLEVDGAYYWVGQDFTPDKDPTSISKVNMYKSTDFLNWDKVGSVLTANTPDVNGNLLLASCKVERPKLLYNAPTKKYVLWAHWEVNDNYGPSEIITATADHVEGPYTITKTGHRRPGFGNTASSAMGDRYGGVITDYYSAPKVTSNTNHPYKPVQPDYPPQALQYYDPSASNPDQLSYRTSDYGILALGTINLKFILKAIVVKMTAFDRAPYDKYSADFDISTADYIVRYPTTTRSGVTTANFNVGTPDSSRANLVAPVIHPGLDESSDTSTVLVNSGDAAFITVTTDGATIYYTTDGSDPSTSSNKYTAGTRIPVVGAAGKVLTVNTIAVLSGENSATTTLTYTVAADSSKVPIFKPVINLPSGTYDRSSAAFAYGGIRVYAPTNGAVAYYTTDGVAPNPPLKGANIGYRSRDFTVWQDPQNDVVFLIGASDDVFFRIWELTDDYTDVVADKEYDVFVHNPREAPALIRNKGKDGQYVYMITSSQSGYYPNQSQYKRTKDLTTGFGAARDPTTGYRDGQASWGNLEPIGDASTYYSQPTWIIDVGNAATPVYVYVGDRNAVGDLYSSSYVFMQLIIDDNAPAVTGDTGTGLMTISYVPNLQLDVKNQKVIPPADKLLSLHKPVDASEAVALTADDIALGTINYTASVANDGVNFDISPYDSLQQYYQPLYNPFYWSVDLGKSYKLTWIGISVYSVGGSDAVYQYEIEASNDGKSWTTVINNRGNWLPGFTSHILTGSYRYVKFSNYNIIDVIHHKEADWEKGVYEISVYGTE